MTCTVCNYPEWKENFSLTGYSSEAACGYGVVLKKSENISRRNFVILLLKDENVTKDVNLILKYITRINKIEFFEIEAEVNLILETSEIITFKVSQKVLEVLKSL